MRVALFPADETACGFYRMRLPAEVASRECGVETIFRTDARRHVIGAVFQGELELDVIVFQRPSLRLICEYIPRLQEHGVAVVVELDDDFAHAHPQSAIFETWHPANARSGGLAGRIMDQCWHHLREAVRLADLVTVTTPALASRYGRGKAIVLPNRVPRGFLDVSAERDGRTIGWGGTTATHIDDLKVTRGGVAQAVDETAARFLQVGPTDDVRRDLGLSAEPDTTGGLPFDAYHRALARLDVGIAPLADSLFNQAKSGLKVLEFAALGVPCVASPRPEYERLAEQDLCVLAKDRSRDWRRECKRLLLDGELRAGRSAQARETIRERHLYEGSGHLWAEAWAEAVKRRRAAVGFAKGGVIPQGRAVFLRPGERVAV